MTAGEIDAAFRAACADELAALKPGNVHVHADGHGMTVADFARSAEVASGPLCAPGARLGARILGAIAATRDAVGQNTNLGIVLLCAPLAAAAERADAAADLRHALGEVLEAADMDDARKMFAAIALASPGGLGEVSAHDARSAPTVLARQAMAAAADRDRIAREWSTGFAGIFEFGLPTLRAASGGAWATTQLHLAFMAAWPDSHVARKHGVAVAAAIQAEAVAMRAAAPHELLAWDASLKARTINPGTSADLTVATLFADRLISILRARSVGD